MTLYVGVFPPVAPPIIIKKIIKDFNLEDKKDTKACNLSGGQKRKLSICIALVGGSSVIFLDEPTSGIDVTF